MVKVRIDRAGGRSCHAAKPSSAKLQTSHPSFLVGRARAGQLTH